MRRMNSSGFWFRCAADRLLGLCTRGAARRMVPLIRSTPFSGGSCHTLVSPCACRHLCRNASQDAVRLVGPVERQAGPLPFAAHPLLDGQRPVGSGDLESPLVKAQTSDTTGKRLMVLPLTFPAMWAIPLSQVMACTYSQPCRTSSGCTVAQPTSVFQSHSVVAGTT
jgi:hypothetical protein